MATGRQYSIPFPQTFALKQQWLACNSLYSHLTPVFSSFRVFGGELC